MQGDEPVRATGAFKPGSVVQEEEDDYHARTERVIAFAQPCEYNAIHVLRCKGAGAAVCHHRQRIQGVSLVNRGAWRMVHPVSAVPLQYEWQLAYTSVL
jgi:hypothetical protein